jgi:membrane associated rhomboid family serine protease
VTALGLHLDLLHLAGNLAFGTVFGVMLAQSIGFGLAWLTFVTAVRSATG